MKRLPFSVDAMAFLLALLFYLYPFPTIIGPLSRTEQIIYALPIVAFQMSILSFGVIQLLRRFTSFPSFPKYKDQKKKKFMDLLIFSLGFGLFIFKLLTS